MEPEQAIFLRDYLVLQWEREHDTTRRILAAMPEEHRQYRPHPTCRSAMELAWHLTSCEIWCLEGLIHGQFGAEQARMPVHIRKIADVVECWERSIPGLLAEVRQLPAEHLLCPLSADDLRSYPAVVYLHQMLVHTAHHRGQLSTYIRSVGAPVPSIYGGSADEPFRASAC